MYMYATNIVNAVDGIMQAQAAVYIRLTQITVDDNSRVSADACHEHFYFFCSAILRLIKHDKTAVKRFAAHIRKRLNNDITIFNGTFDYALACITYQA